MNYLFERDKLIKKIEILLKEFSENTVLVSLKNTLIQQDSPFNLNGLLSRIVVDSLEINSNIGEEIISFEHFYRNPLNLIESGERKKVINYLIKRKIKINYIGQAWSENCSVWIYFDTILNISKLREKLSLSENIVEHKNIDPKSGLELGFVDNITNEGVMGNLKI